MPRIKLILNPASDRGRTAKIGEALQALLYQRSEIERQRGTHYELDWELTEHSGQAVELAHRAAQAGYDMVVAVGGDGTVHEVVNGLMKVDQKKRPKLGVLPAGSGNDFAHNLNLPDTVEDCVHCLFGDSTRKIDIGLIKDGSGREVYWDNTVGMGFSGAVNIAAKKITRIYGFLMYLTAVVQTIIATRPRIGIKTKIDDQPEQQRRVAMISMCNGPREGGGFPVAPHALMDDGYITYMFMREVNRLQMFYFLPIVMAANHLKYTSFFEEGTAKHLTIEANQTLAIHTDGETWAPWEADVRQVEVSILPAAIEVMCNC